MNEFYPLAIAELKHDTRDMLVVRLAVPPDLREKFRYRAGQHVVVRQNIEGEELRRHYSICASEAEQELRIGIKKIADGVFSQWAHENLRVGDKIDISPPTGHFGWPHIASRRVSESGGNISVSESGGNVSVNESGGNINEGQHFLMIAAGSGITPILSLMTTILAANATNRVTLVYGNRATGSVIFREEIAALKDRYLDRLAVLHILSREPQEIDALHGRITAAKMLHLAHRWIDFPTIDQAFLCGPAAMMEDVVMALRNSGLAAERIQREMFTVNAAPRLLSRRVVAADHAALIEFIIDGHRQNVQITNRTDSLLETALAHGLEVRYSCKSGVCATCRCKILAGKVDMDASYALEDYEIARGFVLACQAYPVSDKMTVDFDCDS